MRQGRKLKEALINYRNTCQHVNVGSLDVVIQYLVKTASDRAEAARAEAQARLDDVLEADLEADASPEELLLSYVSGEKSADRTDREVVTPWFKFLWETHRNVLDVLRNNSRLEALYAAEARRAFAFCLHYKRTTEFRRLCDVLRNHLMTLIKYKDQVGRDRTDLSVPSTWELYIEMRFEQLRTACDLELWAEAFRSVEDIRWLISLAPKGVKGPKPSLMAVYYSRLTQIFTRSGARLYNAYAWYRLFTFSRTLNKSLTPADVTVMASNVVLSALSVLPYDPAATASAGSASSTAISGSEPSPMTSSSVETDRATKMASILGFNVESRRDGRPLLSRAALLADIERKGLLQLVPAEVKAIYQTLEGDPNPLQLCKALIPLLEGLPALGENMSPSSACPVDSSAATALGSYVSGLQQVALTHTVRQLSEVYSVMRVSSLSNLAPFGWAPGETEALIVDAVRHGYLSAKFDHGNGTVLFGGQDLDSDRVRNHVAVVTRRLARALLSVAPKEAAAARDAKRSAAVQRAMEVAEEDNQRALARRHIIEKKKEEAERLMMEREMEAEAKRAAAEAEARKAEERRRDDERKRREQERIQKEIQEKEEEILRNELAARGKKVTEGEAVDVVALKAELRREEDVKATEMRRRLTKLAKQMDHLERAKREEEASLREEAAAARVKDEEALWQREQEAAKVAHRQAWERDLDMKHKLGSLQSDVAAFAEAVQSRRAAEFEALRKERERQRAEAHEAHKEERELARKREFVRRCRAEIEERRRAEEERIRREEEEKKAREAAERQRKLDEIAEKQRQRELEIEAKARAEKGVGLGAAVPEAPVAAARKGGYVPPHLRRSRGEEPPAPERPAPERPAPERTAPEKPAPEKSAPERPAPAPASAARSDEKPGVWRPSRLRQDKSDDRPPSGAYRPPAVRGGSRW